MNLKEKIITTIISVIIVILYFIVNGKDNYNSVEKVYNVYLDGKNIGAINDKEALYALIDEKQQIIKNKYEVDTVYPPNGLEIVENYSYNTKISDLNTIYNKIEELQDFTILGYEIKVVNNEDNKEFTLNVLDKEVFNSAIKEFILAFIDENDFKDYMNGDQKELEEGSIIYKNLDILEDISIKETYISINDKIYQDENTLTQDLLFGFQHKEQKYTIKSGDTIESIAEDFELNPKEILIANSKYKSEDSLLAIGDTLTVAYVIPEISFSYEVNEMKLEEYDYGKETKRDNNLPVGYSEITTPGVTGLKLVTSGYTVVNGKLASKLDILDEFTIREKVNQVTTKGKKATSWGWEIFEDTGSGWTWPTVDRYVVTSPFGYRELGGGKQHNGIDISGTPWGSNIYAANDGTVVYVHKGCPDNGSYPNSCGGGYGNWVIIDHGSNIYTVYAHMLKNIPVSVGQVVSKGQVVGYMGNSGQSTGTHLHFGLSVGDPRSDGKFRNPRELYR